MKGIELIKEKSPRRQHLWLRGMTQQTNENEVGEIALTGAFRKKGMHVVCLLMQRTTHLVYMSALKAQEKIKHECRR